MFRLPKHKQFDFKPRYYDERKERLEQRRREIERDRDNMTHDDFRASMQNEWGRDHRRTTIAKSNKRLLYIVGGLVILVWFLFFN